MIAHHRRSSGADVPATPTLLESLELHSATSSHGLMMVEFDHRFHNLLAQVNAIIRQTLNGSDDERVVAQTLIYRFSSLAATNSVFKGLAGGDEDVFTVLEQELKPFLGKGDRRVGLSGDPMMLPGELVLALRFVLHELATNLLKHDALSNVIEHVGIKWNGDDDGVPTLILAWTEHVGHSINYSLWTGVGFLLIRRALGARAIAEPLFEFSSDTLLFTFSARADQPQELVLVVLHPRTFHNLC